MVPLRIVTLILTGPNQPSVLVLEPIEEPQNGKSRILPIWIRTHEAAHIGLALEHVRLPRPMTHDLFLDALTNLDTIVDHVLISGMKGPTFYAKLVLRQGDRLIELDARPTDALSLAIRQEAPFFINEDLLEQASYPYLFKEKRDDEELLQEFRVFLDDVVPDDFKS